MWEAVRASTGSKRCRLSVATAAETGAGKNVQKEAHGRTNVVDTEGTARMSADGTGKHDADAGGGEPRGRTEAVDDEAHRQIVR